MSLKSGASSVMVNFILELRLVQEGIDQVSFVSWAVTMSCSLCHWTYDCHYFVQVLFPFSDSRATHALHKD